MEKIRLGEFNENFNIVLAYALRHLINEDWSEYDGSMVVDNTFDTRQHYVLATKKCLEYKEILEDYEKSEQRNKGCVFLDA